MKSLKKLKHMKINSFIMGAMFLAHPLFGETIGKSIATINGEAIYLSEYESNWEALLEQQTKAAPEGTINDEWKKSNKKLLLDQMIEEKLLVQEAKKRKIIVPKRQLEEGLLQVKNRFKILAPGTKPTKEDYERDLTEKEKVEFLKELKLQDITEKEFEARIEDQLRVLRLSEEEVRSRVESPFKESSKTDTEDRDLTGDYEKRAKGLFTDIEKKFNDKAFKPNPEDDIDRMTEVLKAKLGEAVHARHILIKSARSDDFKKRQAAMEKIKAIKKELDGGADFIEVANEKSEGSNSKNGGDLGFFSKGQMVPEFEKVAFTLPVGGISDVIETEFGYHLIMVEEKRAARRLRFDDIKADLANYLYQKQVADRYEVFVNELRKKADIKVLVNLDSIKG
jgi:peptidyl-prolyl cis-trans isomerase C